MTTYTHRYVVLLGLCGMMSVALAADRPAWMPVASEGVINGTVAVTIMPGVDGATGNITLQDPAGCEIHLVPENEKHLELTWGCGEWFQPPAPGKHLVWIEKEGGISRSQQVLKFSVLPFEGQGSLGVHEWQPAGRIALAPATAVQGDTIRFLSLAPTQNVRTFERRLAGRSATESVRMPVGSTLAGVFDERGNAIGLSRPVQVKQGQTAYAAVGVPSDKASHVLAVLTGMRDPDCGQVTLQHGDRSRNPDVIVRSYERAIAVWYDVPAQASAARLQPQCAGEGVAVSLTPGKITTVRQSITIPPNREKEKR